MTELVSRMPVRVTLNAEAGLLGAAVYAQHSPSLGCIRADQDVTAPCFSKSLPQLCILFAARGFCNATWVTGAQIS